MAFGGVATGSIKAQDAAIVQADISIKGCNPMDKPRGASMGSIIDVVAKFEVISVRREPQSKEFKQIKSNSHLSLTFSILEKWVGR